MKLFLIVLAPIFFLSGCAMFTDEITRSAEKVQEGIDDYYCQASQENRAKFRAQVFPTPGGATGSITCPGDS